MSLEHATPIRLSSVSPSHVSKKLRVFGRISHYNHHASLIILQDPARKTSPPAGLFVDVSLCLDPFASLAWTREKMNILMAIGYLELSPTMLPVSDLEKRSRPLSKVDSSLVLRAISLEECDGLDVELWDDVFKTFEGRGDYPIFPTHL